MNFFVLKLCSIGLFLVLRRPTMQAIYASTATRIVELRSSAAQDNAVSAWKQRLPWALVALRAALAPGIVLISQLCSSGLLLAGIVMLALVSDVYDGVLARRWQVDTPRLRRCDTGADTLFYLGVILVLALRYPTTASRLSTLFAVLIAVEIGQHLFAFLKYRRNASYHSLLAKSWGLLLAGAVIGLFAFGLDNWYLTLAVAWGVLCNVEGFIMSLLLPSWQRDVPTLAHAWRLRKQLMASPSFAEMEGEI
jgi:CDP-diacylglycerol--glycerol-3-phosphate 3-phosphatidyltransferase